MKNNKFSNNRKLNRGSQFFEQMIREFGNDFLNRATPLNLVKKSNLLFRDFAHGNIDMDKYGQYFTNPQFIELMYRTSFEKMMYYCIHLNGYNSIKLSQNPQIRNLSTYQSFSRFEKEDSESYQAYQIISNGFSVVLSTGDISNFVTMVNSLRPFKYSL